MNLSKLLAKIPGWVGLVLLIVVGFAMFIHGAFNPLSVELDRANRAGFIIFGLASLIIGAFSLIARGSGQVTGRTGVGPLVRLGGLPGWAMAVNLGLVALSALLFFIVK